MRTKNLLQLPQQPAAAYLTGSRAVKSRGLSSPGPLAHLYTSEIQRLDSAHSYSCVKSTPLCCMHRVGSSIMNLKV